MLQKQNYANFELLEQFPDINQIYNDVISQNFDDVSYQDLNKIDFEMQNKFPGLVDPFKQVTFPTIKFNMQDFNINDDNKIINNQEINGNTNSFGKFEDKEDFLKTLIINYKQVLSEKGLDPNFAYALTTSAALESGWGKKVSGKFNYGGVKSKTGTVKSTIDYVPGKGNIRRNQTFRDFKSVKDYCNYVVNLLNRKDFVYKQAFNKFSANDPFAFWEYVLRCGYGGGSESNIRNYMNSFRKIYNNIRSKNFDISTVNNNQSKYSKSTDIEEVFRREGLTSVNGKDLKFGRKTLRPQNAPYGSKNSYHKKLDPDTGNAMARDISITKGNIDDYAEFRRLIMSNKNIVNYLKLKGWGILNEITPEAFKRYKSTGPHFHFAPGGATIRTFYGWEKDPTVDVTKLF